MAFGPLGILGFSRSSSAGRFLLTIGFGCGCGLAKLGVDVDVGGDLEVDLAGSGDFFDVVDVGFGDGDFFLRSTEGIVSVTAGGLFDLSFSFFAAAFSTRYSFIFIDVSSS